MTHFNTRLTSPTLALSSGIVFLIITTCILQYLGFFSSDLLKWGPPLTIFGQSIVSESTFYLLLVIFFGHQLVNNWISEVVYPWIINCVQDPKAIIQDVGISSRSALILINIHAIYSELDLFLMLAGFSSQISFVIAIICANLITSTIINYKYLQAKVLNQEQLSDSSDSLNEILIL